MRRVGGCTVIAILILIACIAAINHVRSSNLINPESRRGVLARLDASPKQYPALPGSEVFADAAEKISPAVVNIDVVGHVSPRMDEGMVLPPEYYRGKGSGVIISPDGFVITNNHVVQSADEIQVKLRDGRTFTGRPVGTDPDTDLAVVKVNASGLPTAELGDSDKLRVAEWVIAVGNPLGFENTVTLGIVSALHRNFDVNSSTRFADAIQTDAAINHGNSGGALGNINGQLVGINAVIAGGETSGNIGIGFAIPVNTVKRIARQLIANGKIIRPWLGISFSTDDEQSRLNFNMKNGRLAAIPNGLWVRGVIAPSPAQLAGIHTDDVIVALNDKPIKDRWDFTARLEDFKIGQVISVKVWRDGKQVPLLLKLGERPQQL